MKKCFASAFLLFFAIVFIPCLLQAQTPLTNKPVEKELPPPRNVKVLKEYKDGKGNIVREIQYSQGMMRVTETVIMPEKHIGYVRVPVNPDTMRKDSVLVVVNKSQYNLQVFYRHRMIRSYKAVFGPRPLDNKCMEGDRCTPEGWFTILNKNPASRYNKFMLLSYPNDSAMARFNRLKQNKIIPQGARIGGDIGIHGIWPKGDDMIEMGIGWTDGCVALKNKDVDDLYTLVGIGTRVYVRK